MFFRTERRRKQIEMQFDYWLKEAKMAKQNVTKATMLGDLVWSHEANRYYDMAVEEARHWAKAMEKTGGYGIVEKKNMEKKITKLNEE